MKPEPAQLLHQGMNLARQGQWLVESANFQFTITMKTPDF